MWCVCVFFRRNKKTKIMFSASSLFGGATTSSQSTSSSSSPSPQTNTSSSSPPSPPLPKRPSLPTLLPNGTYGYIEDFQDFFVPKIIEPPNKLEATNKIEQPPASTSPPPPPPPQDRLPVVVRPNRAFRHFKNPPQPHMCIRDTNRAGDELFINVMSWTRIVMPMSADDPIPLYGGMRVNISNF